MNKILIRGARAHNLKNIDLDLPRDKLIVITGLSGSGKSSLAFDTLYAEGQRRYVESLSAYARQFLSVMAKPDVDQIAGLSPAISIEQKTTSHNPRSTVGTITEIYDYLRLLFARIGTPFCPQHGIALDTQTISQMVDQILALPENVRFMLLAPIVAERKGEYRRLFTELATQGFVRVRVDGNIYELDTVPMLELNRKHSIEVIVDRFQIRSDLRLRLTESIETALKLSDGTIKVARMDDTAPELVFSARFACPVCGYSVVEMQPRLFSFNNPAGACPTCDGLGTEQAFDPNKVVAYPDRSVIDGALHVWDGQRGNYYFQQLYAVAQHYNFDLDTPWCKLTDKQRQLILYGTGTEVIEFRYISERSLNAAKRQPFEGVLENLQRRYRETESNAVREELSQYLADQPCPKCAGTRLNETARHVQIAGQTLPQLTALSVKLALTWFHELKLTGAKGKIGDKITKEIALRLEFLVNVGLDYLTLDRSANTLSGGETQRIRLASQIGAGLVGVMYILDEPSIGLHQRDNNRLLATLTNLRDLGNTVIVVEHDAEAIRAADLIVDMGPGAGKNGGQITAIGTATEISANPASLTGRYLSGKLSIAVPSKRCKPDTKKWLKLSGASGHNLKNINLEIPLGTFCCITGMSGSGKSTLINDTLYPLAANKLNGANRTTAPYGSITGLEFLDKVIDIDQSPIGRTPRSNPATYTDLFTHIRELFASVPEARSRGYTIGRFSFNVKGGRCEACDGDGVIKVEMHFLPDVYVQCDVCQGRRYNRETLDIMYKGRNINDVLQMTVAEALEFFTAIPQLQRKLETLMDVGLSYIQLGQNATTLSGGEAQRVKLAKELSRRDTGKTLYLLDEPTTGLHFQDIEHLLTVLHRLRDHGNTIVVIEHNLDVIKTADWVIDLGPEGGDRGGEIVATGTPEKIAKCDASFTGQYLKSVLKKKRG
jgi:excinuclease ABC subunit A